MHLGWELALPGHGRPLGSQPVWRSDDRHMGAGSCVLQYHVPESGCSLRQSVRRLSLAKAGRDGQALSYSIATLRSNLKSVNSFPVPRTTLTKGSSAINTGSPVSSRIRLS